MFLNRTRSLIIYAVIAFLGLTLFGSVRHVMPIYFGRLRLRNLTAPPPPFRTRKKEGTPEKRVGWFKRACQFYYGWIPHVLKVDDKTLISTAGLDAFAFLRVCQFGLQLFVPLSLMSLLLLLPVHLTGKDIVTQHREYVANYPGTSESEPTGLILTTVANIEKGEAILWLHTACFIVVVLYSTWLLNQHCHTFVVLRTLYLTTRGDTNLWRAVHQPSNVIEQLLMQGTKQATEIDGEELRKLKSATSDDINEACDALAMMNEYEEEDRNLLSRTMSVGAQTAKTLVSATAHLVGKSTRESARASGELRRDEDSRLTSMHSTPVLTSTPTSLPHIKTTASTRRLSPYLTESSNVVATLKGAGTLKSQKPGGTPKSAESDKRSSFLKASPQYSHDSPPTPRLSGAPKTRHTPASEANSRLKDGPGPVSESRVFASFTSGDSSEEFDLSINPPVSEPPNKSKRRDRKLRLGSFGSLGSVPQSVSAALAAQVSKDTEMKPVASSEDLNKNLMGSVMYGEAPGPSSLLSPQRKSPRRRRAPTLENIDVANFEDVALTPAVKKALERVKSLEQAGENVRAGGMSDQGAIIRASTSIAHEWWTGMDITQEYEKSQRVAHQQQHRSENVAPPAQTMDTEIKRKLSDAFDEHVIPDSPESMNSPVTRASYNVGNHLFYAPASVPDVDSIRTVNAYDEHTKQIVSVWASSYTVLITDIPFVRSHDEDGNEVRVRGLREVEATLEYIYGDEFRGLIPIFDHRPVDALLDSRDECVNAIAKLSLQMAREGILPQTNASAHGMTFGENIPAVKKRDIQVGYNFHSFVKYFRDLLKMPKRLKRLSLQDRLAVLEAQLCAIDEAIVEVRKSTWEGSPGPSCFAVFENQVAASTAAQCIISRASNRIYRALPAPGPDDVNWQTLLFRSSDNSARALAVWPIILMVMLFPTGMFATAVTSVCQVRQGNDIVGGAFFDWYCSDDAAVYTGLISGVLPPVLLTLWEVFVISFYMLYLVQKQNAHVSLSATDRRFLRFYWSWGVVNVLMGGIFGGAIGVFTASLNSGATFSDVQEQIGRVLPLSSNFFLLFIVFRAVYLPVQRLLLPHPGSICMAFDIFWCEKRGKCARTPRDKTRLYSPRAVRMGREIGVFMLILLLGLTFVTIAPLIPLAACVFFVTNFVIWRYHVLYVYERGHESNGAVWFPISQLVLLSLLIAQTFLSCVLFSKSAYFQGGVLYVTVPFYLNKVNKRLRKEFGSSTSWSVPLSEATAAPPTDFGGEIYTHAALRPAAEGWYPDIGKVWKGYPGVTSKNFASGDR